MTEIIGIKNIDPVEKIKNELSKHASTKRQRIVEKFILAALGSIPWVGGFISAAGSIKSDEGAVKMNVLQTEWLKEHEEKMGNLSSTIEDIIKRFESIQEEVLDRMEDEDYLNLVRKTFRTWDNADTQEKRKYSANLIVNASATKICSDDIIRLFIDWLDLYHEAHFAVIREIFKNPQITRYEIWSNLNGTMPREDSAEADLYKLLIRDLSTGGVIRQDKEVNHSGQFMKSNAPRMRSSSRTMESAFEDTKGYVLTELGKQFVHYTMNEVVTRIE
jgi:hypothetical protein